MLGTVNAVASSHILRSVRDTAKRFENSSGGGKEWRATLTEIISHLPGGQSSFDIDRKLSVDLTGDQFQRNFFLDDGGDIYTRETPTRLGLVGVELFGPRRNGVYQWIIGPLGAGTSPPPDWHVIHSRQCAWFIERLRQLGFASLIAIHHAARSGFGQCEMTWRTLITFLQFTLEQSNWTTELRPPHLPALTFEEKLDRCFERISGQDRLGQNVGVPLHQLFNQEQREDLALLATEDAGAETDEAEDGSPPAHSWRSRAEIIAEQEQEETLKKEKGQLVEILGILGEKAEKSELEEGAYKEYADLLMKFHKILGEERQRIVNV